MAASIQSTPPIGQLKQIAYTTRAGTEKTLSIEQIPGGYQLPFATLFNQWQVFGHMKGRIYPTVDALLDDAAQGWKTWREHTPLPALTNSEETAIIRAALHRADIHPKRVRHYRGPVIIEMDHTEARGLSSFRLRRNPECLDASRMRGTFAWVFTLFRSLAASLQ